MLLYIIQQCEKGMEKHDKRQVGEKYHGQWVETWRTKETKIVEDYRPKMTNEAGEFKEYRT